MVFRDRAQAGQRLADLLRGAVKPSETVIFALPRGGVIVAAEVAKKINVPLDLIITRKIGHPRQPEYAVAAVSKNVVLVDNLAEIEALDPGWFKEEIARQRKEISRREKKYGAGAPPLSSTGKNALLIDDGIATGLTMRAAIEELRTHKPATISVAVPVAPADTISKLKKSVDEVVVLYVPSGYFGAIGSYYRSFPQVADEEVIAALQKFHA